MFSDRSTILFDLDGTLVDSGGDLAAALNHVLAADSLPALDRGQVLRMVGDGAPVLIERAYRLYGIRPPDGTLERFRTHYAEHCLDFTRPYLGIRELLATLSEDRALAVVTNKPTDFAETVVRGLGLGAFLPVVVGPERAQRKKPAPEHVLAALSTLGREPRDAVMVGDSDLDVVSGHDAGTATVAVLWGFRHREDFDGIEPDAFAETVAELGTLLLGRRAGCSA